MGPDLVMGLGQNFLTLVGSGQPFMVWVRIWNIFPKNVKFFNIFLSGQTKTLRVVCKIKSMLGLSQVRAHLYTDLIRAYF